MRSLEMGQEDPIVQKETAVDIEPTVVVSSQEEGVSVEEKEKEPSLETERREFLDGLIIPGMNEFRRELCDAFEVDDRHVPPFIADLVFSLDTEKLQELREIAGDYNLSTGYEVLKCMTEDLNSICQDGRDPFEKYYRFGRKLGIKVNLFLYAEIVRLFTGKEFTGPDFITEDTVAAGLKGNAQLSQYAEQVKSFWANLIKEKSLKYKDIDTQNWLKKVTEYPDGSNKETDNSALDDLDDDREWVEKREFFEGIIKQCRERLRQFVLSQPLKQKRVFEIGGTALKRTLGQAGAEAVSFDATGFDWSKWGRSEETTRVSNTMNSRNYREILDQIDTGHPEHHFDLTTSREVIDSGSGIENTVASRKLEDAIEEILRVLANITGSGGLSIHQVGYGYDELFERNERERLAKIGFEKVFTLSGRENRRLRMHPFFVKRKEAPEDLTMDFEEPTVVLRRK